MSKICAPFAISTLDIVFLNSDAVPYINESSPWSIFKDETQDDGAVRVFSKVEYEISNKQQVF